MVRVCLVVVICTLLVQTLVVWVALGLNADADANVASGLLGCRVGRRSWSRRSRLEHGRVFDEGLGNIPRTVGCPVVLVLGVCMCVVVGYRRRVALLGPLSAGRLGLGCRLG